MEQSREYMLDIIQKRITFIDMNYRNWELFNMIGIDEDGNQLYVDPFVSCAISYDEADTLKNNTYICWWRFHPDNNIPDFIVAEWQMKQI